MGGGPPPPFPLYKMENHSKICEVWKTWSNGKPKHKEKVEDVILSMISPIWYEPSSLQVQCMWVQVIHNLNNYVHGTTPNFNFMFLLKHKPKGDKV